MTTLNERQLAAADAEVKSWGRLPAEGRAAVVAAIKPTHGPAILSIRGVDLPFETVTDAIDEAVRQGIPLSRVKVEPFPTPSVVLAESPGLRSI